MPTRKLPGGENGRSAIGIDSYTEKEYNNYGWARENGVLTAQENERLRSRFAEAVTGQAKPPKSKSGEYMIAVGEKTDNKIVYMTGTIDDPVITRVLEIDGDNETIIDELRREIYAIEGRGIQRKTGGVFHAYTAASFRGSNYQQRSSIQSQRYNNQFGANRGRGSKGTPKIKEILFDDDGNEISRTYRSALSDTKRVAFYDGKNTVYLDATAPKSRIYSALLGHEVFHRMFKSTKVKKLFMQAWKNIGDKKRREVIDAYTAELKKNKELSVSERISTTNEEVAAASEYRGKELGGAIDSLTKIDWRGTINASIARKELKILSDWYVESNPMFKKETEVGK